jgi:ketosteroid isomerase-like protein
MTSAPEVELRALEASLLAAMREHDFPALSQLFDHEYVFTSGSGEVWGRERALRDFADPGLSLRHLEVELERIIPLVDAGVVIGRSRVEGAAGGASVSGVYRFTRVWRRVTGKWTVLAVQTSRTQPSCPNP